VTTSIACNASYSVKNAPGRGVYLSRPAKGPRAVRLSRKGILSTASSSGADEGGEAGVVG
jgi:hypothetical protein